MTTRTAKGGIFSRRMIIAMVAMGIIALALGYFVHPAYADAGYNAGTHGEPTDGTNTDLKGGIADFSFEQNAVLSCEGDTATSFSFNINYEVTGAALPADAILVVYLSPNQGAINNNAGGDAAGYIADVESNYFVKDVSGLTGSGSFPVTVTVSTSFELNGGGVLGVFASEAGAGGQSWTAKSNSVQCSEAESIAESVPESEAASVPESEAASVPESEAESVAESASEAESAEQSVEASGESSFKAGEGTPEGSVSNGALSLNGVGALPTIAFSLILLASLGALAYANVKSVRS